MLNHDSTSFTQNDAIAEAKADAKLTLLQAVQLQDDLAIKRILRQIIQVGFDGGFSEEQIVDVLAAHEVLAGRSTREFIHTELQKLQQRANEPNMPPTS
jgi:hypothetical protein